MKLSTSMTALLLLSVSLPGLSQEIAESSTLTPQLTRSQLQTQVQAMSAEDRALYRQLNGGNQNGAGKHAQGEGRGQGKGRGRGDGNHQRKRDGSGKGGANRQRSEYQQRSNFGSGYGSGYGSRQGGFGRR